MLILLAGRRGAGPQLADRLQHREPARRRAARRAPTSPTSRSAFATITRRLAWLAGSVALDRMNRPASAIAMFDRYAPRRPLAAGPDQGLLLGRAGGARRRALPGRQRLFPARRRLSRAVLRPARARAARPVGPAAAAALPQYVTTPAAARRRSTAAGWSRRSRLLGQQGRSTEQALFVQRARRIARQRRRPQPRGRARPADRPPGPRRCGRPAMARVKGSMFYVRQAYPTLRARCRASCGRWPTASAGRKARSTPMPSAMPARAG